MLIFIRRIVMSRDTTSSLLFKKKRFVSLGCHDDALICLRISCMCAARIVSRAASQRVSLRGRSPAPCAVSPTLLLSAVLASCSLVVRWPVAWPARLVVAHRWSREAGYLLPELDPVARSSPAQPLPSSLKSKTQGSCSLLVFSHQGPRLPFAGRA